MRKAVKALLLGILIAVPIFAKATVPVMAGAYMIIDLVYNVVDKPTNKGPKRTPLKVPTVYLDSSSSTILFDNPCYSCEIELVDLDTEMTVYTYSYSLASKLSVWRIRDTYT